MLRLQAPLPDDYTLATDDELVARIAAAKDALGDRLADPRSPLPARRGDPLGRRRSATRSSSPASRRTTTRRPTSCSAVCTSWPSRPTCSPATTSGSSSPTSTPAARWPTWPTSTRSRRRGTRSRAITAIDRVVPITYMNSSAALKAFVGRNGGAVCTSSNARAVLEWALAAGDKVLFFPDQHLGRNTGFTMGFGEADMRVWNPRHELGGLEERDVKDATFLLWKGHCSVHQRFRPEHVDAARAEHPGVEVIVHPECAHDVVELADRVGSTERIQEWVAGRAAPGAVLAVGTEIHMVQRLARAAPRQDDRLARPARSARARRCSASTRPHLAWVLENLVAGDGREPDRRRRRHDRVGAASRSNACSTSPDRDRHTSCGRPAAAGAGSSRASRYSCALARKPSGGAGSSMRSISRPLRGHRVDVLRQRAVHERQHARPARAPPSSRRREVRADAPVLLVEDVVDHPAAVRRLEQRVVEEEDEPAARLRARARLSAIAGS